MRIVVALPSGHHAEPTLGALRRLGREVELVAVHDATRCLNEARDGGVDLVVADRALGEETDRILEGLRSEGPPVVVVAAEASDEVALDAFRRGAADCVAASDDFPRVLAIVALEQIRRWRAVRERGAVERRLRTLERLNDVIVEAIPAALAVLDAEGHVVGVNPEFSSAFGVPPEAAQGQPLERLLPQDLLESAGLIGLLAKAALQRGVEARVARGVGPDGSPRAFDARARRLGDDGRLLLVLADVTERERLAKRIADLQRYTENIIQNLNSALLVVDVEGRITFANAMAERILGATRLRGHSVGEWFPTTPRHSALLLRTLEEGVRFRGAEATITRADGQWLPIGVSCAPLVDADGSKLGAVAVFQDLSEIKELQRHVLQAEKMASIGQLAAGVAHEINNPMGFIHANLFQMAEYLHDLRRLWDQAEALRRTAGEGDLARIQAASAALGELANEVDADYVLADFAKAVRESQEGSERIRHIVQDLRHFSRHDPSERTFSDVNECLDSTANIVWTMMKHSVVLEKHYSQLPRLRCYPMQLKQVFMNLLVNAYQAIEEKRGPQGGHGRVRLATQQRGDNIVVTVSDDGVGIAPENLSRIFDPFFTTKEVGMGTGLGLSTCFSIVERHGGTIRVDSQPGAGSTFEVVLPLSGHDEPRPEPGP